MMQSLLPVGRTITVPTATTVDLLQTDFQEALVKWIVEKLTNFIMVKHKSFEGIFFVGNRNLTVPSRWNIQSRVLKRAEYLQRALKIVFSDFVTHVTLMKDAWLSSIYRRYSVINAHWIGRM